MHTRISPQIERNAGCGDHHAPSHLKKCSVNAFDSGELLRIVRHSAFGINATFITYLHDRVKSIISKIFASAIMP